MEFLVIGGQAENLFGSPRLTYDVDFCYRRSKENLVRLEAALAELKPTPRGAPPGLPFFFDLRALTNITNLTLETHVGPLDILGWVEPIGDYDALIQHAETYRIGNLELRTISLEDLIRVKEHINRVKDRDSLLQLKAIQKMRLAGGGKS